MADALLSPFLHQLAAVIREMVEHEVRLVNGVDGQIENLSKNLNAIKLVLKDAEKRKWTDDAVKSWLDELNDISYDMDNVLDKWKTAILQSEIQKEEQIRAEQDQNASFADNIKVRLSVFCRCFHSGPLDRVLQRCDIAHDIKKLNWRLDEIVIRKEMFNFSVATGIDEPIRSNVSTSIIDVSQVRGQDVYKKLLKDRLLCNNSEEGSSLHIIPIVGMGGIGKTTLAKLVYNDDEVKNHFGKRIWVCVSDPFDIVKIAKAIIEQLTGYVPTVNEFETLMQCLTASIKDEKFLLVLDDVWNEEYLKWEQLEKYLLSGAVGKSIVVTTRNVKVARMMGVSEHLTIRVNQLSETDCWLLFSEIAFFGKTKEDQEDLEPIGRKIALKCNGLPLAAKTLGSLLRVKTTKKEWLDVLESDIWRLENFKENLFYPLLLSYFDLSPIEKRCFLHCAIYRKDEKIDKDDLICLWMAQGYLNSQKNAEEEVIGEGCFNNLAMRSFFQDFVYGWEGEIMTCKMHDIVHDFAQFLTLNEYSSFVADNIERKDYMNARHLTVTIPLVNEEDQTSCILPTSNQKNNLHSLMVLGPEIANKDLIDWCLHFTCLKTFILKTPWIKDIPKSIGDLIHLRYLHLDCNRFNNDELRELPRTLGNLCNLQTLRVGGFCVPKEAAKRIKLKHITGVGDADYPSISRGIQRLKNLQTLHVRLSGSTDKSKFQLQDLVNLYRLHELWIQYVGIEQGHVEGARKAQLNQKTSLKRLGLRFDGVNNEIQKATLEALQPPPNLDALAIYEYGGGVIPPNWIMSLNHVKLLVICYCPTFETLPPLGRLPSLEKLRISEIRRINKVGLEFLGILQEEEDNIISTNNRVITLFPKLKHLEFYNMQSWCEWLGIPASSSSSVPIMPRLESLKFYNCPELEALPDFLKMIPLKNLRIEYSPKLRSLCEEDIRKEWPKIQHVPNINFLG